MSGALSALRRGPRSLTGRVTLAAVAAVGGALLVAGLAVILVSAHADRSALDAELRRLVARLERPAARFSRPDAGPFDGGPDGGPRLGGAPGPLDPGVDRFIRIVLPSGLIVISGAAVPERFPLPNPGGAPSTVTAGGRHWRTIVRRLGDGSILQVAAGLRDLEDRQRRLRLVVLAALVGALVATALLTRALARFALAPLQRLRGTAGEVAETADLTVRVPAGAGPEEVDALADDLNAMLARLQDTAAGREAALESARRFAADAGHELRTPLTSLRANLATGATTAAAADADRLTALVEQLQALARGEAGPPARVEPVDLGELADAALAGLRGRHPEVTGTLVAPAEGPVVTGEAESLRMILDNLLENAARHGRAGGAVALTVTPADDGATITVDDDGPGIPPAERAHALERFARGADANGPGTGLGLSIAAAQAARHGGGLTLGDAPQGGLRVVVTLRGVAGAST